MAASGCSNTPLYRRAVAPRPGPRRSIPRRLPRRVAAAVSGGRPKTVPIWRMAGARPLARVRRRFVHRGRGPTGLRLAGRRRRLETPHAVLRSSGCPDVGIHPEVGAGKPLVAPLLQVIEAPFRSVIHGLARRACPDVGMLRPLGRRRLDTPHLALPAKPGQITLRVREARLSAPRPWCFPQTPVIRGSFPGINTIPLGRIHWKKHHAYVQVVRIR